MKTINMDWMKPFLRPTQEELHKNVITVTDDIEIKGRMLYHQLEKRMLKYQGTIGFQGPNDGLNAALEHCITEDVCKYVSYDTLYRLLFKDEECPVSDEETYKFVKNLYMLHLGITDEHMLEITEQYKMSGSFCYSAFSGNMWYTLPPLWPRYMTIEDKASFQKRKKEEAIKERKRKAKEAKQKKFEEETPPMTREQTEELKKALIKKYGPLQTPIPKPQKQSQNAPN